MSQKNEKNKIWFKLAEHDLYSMIRNMRYDDVAFIKWQKKRFLKCFVLFLIFGVSLVFISPYFIFVGIGIAIYQWMNDYKRIKSTYNNFLFKKNLTFSKFARMLIPYLYRKNATLYSTFNRMLNRLEEGHVKECLQRLIIDMNNNPNSVEPFKKFALDASGTDNSILFMNTLYDYQQHSFDQSIISELGKMASEDLFNGVDEIINYKLKKFDMYPTKLTMINLIIVFGYMIAMFTARIKEFF